MAFLFRTSLMALSLCYLGNSEAGYQRVSLDNMLAFEGHELPGE